MIIVLVLLAGALGAVLRYIVSLTGSVWAVLIVNVVGSFLAGLAIALLGWRPAVGVRDGVARLADWLADRRPGRSRTRAAGAGR